LSGFVTQDQAARILGVSSRTFRRYINQYDEDGSGNNFYGKTGQITCYENRTFLFVTNIFVF
jgi:transposase